MDLMFAGKFIPTSKDFYYYNGVARAQGLNHISWGYHNWLTRTYGFEEYGVLANSWNPKKPIKRIVPNIAILDDLNEIIQDLEQEG